MNMFLKRPVPLLSLLPLVIALCACDKKETPSPHLANAPATYVVGTDAAYPPLEWEDDKLGIIGFDIDILKAIAEKAGIELRFVNTPFESIFNFLQQGDRDILISSITITDDRRKTVDFSAPYFEARQLVVTHSNRTAVKKFEDLKNLKVAAQSSTTGDLLLQQLMGKNSVLIKRMDTIPLALSELESGGVDAVVTDEAAIRDYVTRNGAARFHMISDPGFPKEYYGIAVRKGNTALLNKINQGLAAIKADGTYARIAEHYFGKYTQEAQDTQ